MGREARCLCRLAEGEGEVKALLESEVTQVASVSATLTEARYLRATRRARAAQR